MISKPAKSRSSTQTNYLPLLITQTLRERTEVLQSSRSHMQMRASELERVLASIEAVHAALDIGDLERATQLQKRINVAVEPQLFALLRHHPAGEL